MRMVSTDFKLGENIKICNIYRFNNDNNNKSGTFIAIQEVTK
jgi:hypothetical protein